MSAAEAYMYLMFLRTLLIASAFCAFTAPAAMAQGNGGGNSDTLSSNDSAGGQGNESNALGQRTPSIPDGDSSSKASSDVAPRPSDTQSPVQNINQPEEDALRAVQSGEAVPLAHIAESLRESDAGEVIDAKLVQSGQFLLYQLKVLSADGRVTNQLYYARSGQPVVR